jgi:MYND finger
MVAKKTLKSKKKTTKESTEKTVKELCGFSELNCRCCGKGNDEIGGFLLQCATCKKAHYCSKECFNKDLPKHMEFCQTNEPLHRAPKHRVDEEVKLSTTISPANDEKERWDKSFSADTRVKYCSSKFAERGSENVSFRESPLSGNAESEEQNFLNVKADSTVCSLGLHNSSDREYASATDPQQIASSKKTDCESKGSDSVVDTTAYDTQKDECLDYFSVIENGPDVVRINDQSQLKADIAADECLNTMEKSDTADSRHSAKSGKVLCGARDIRASDRGFRKPKRSTSLSRDEGMSDMSDSDGSYCGNLSDSTLHMSDMTESEGEVARRTLRRQREPFASDFAAEKPKRFDSSSSLERVIVSIDQPIDETGNVVNPTSSCMEQEPCISLTVSEEIATSDSFSDSSINSGTETPYQLQRKKGFIIRRQHGNKNHALSDDHDSSPKGGGAVSEFCKEEMRMKKRLNNLWSLPEATIVEKRTEKRGKLQLSRSMKREKGRMHRCLGNLWKLSAASRADKADSGFAFEEWSDLEDSDSEEIRKRRGGGTLGFSDTVTVNSQKLTTETVTLKHLKASEPKHIGWERPEWTEYQ